MITSVVREASSTRKGENHDFHCSTIPLPWLKTIPIELDIADELDGIFLWHLCNPIMN